MSRLLCVLLWFLSLSSPLSAALSPEEIPADLQPWQSWVLHGKEEQLCSHAYNSEKRHCRWPSTLQLTIKEKSATFQQQWQLDKKGWLVLPGNNKQWPSKVLINQKQAVVVEQQGRPATLLEPGSYQVSGELHWQKRPSSLAIPPATALVRLKVDNKEVPFPDIDKDKIWFSRQSKPAQEARDHLGIRVYRHCTDSIPAILTTHIELQVAGQAREELLGWVMPAQQTPLQLKSPFPARLEKNGQLRVQVRPGSWTITLKSRFPAPLTSFTIGEINGPWPEEEIFVFAAQNHLRMVTIEGVTPLDPSQTTLPGQWQNLPAYHLNQADTIQLIEKKRGDPEPEPNQLSIDKQIWLDDDGKAITIQDTVSGTMTSGWRLEMDPSITLGRATVNGQDQLITSMADSTLAGVELRKGQITLQAVSRSDQARTMKAVGWQHGFKKASATLHLPPGWRLLHASGVDRVSSWVSSWNLLDLFIVLITFLAALKLLGPGRGVVGLLTMILLYQDQQAPKLVWLSLLAAIALLKVLPADNRLCRYVKGFRYATLACLLVIALPYLATLLQTAIFPQLEMGRHQTALNSQGGGMPQLVSDEVAPVRTAHDKLDQGQVRLGKSIPQKTSIGSYGSRSRLKQAVYQQYETNAKIQTGPGLPQWQWHQVHIQWNGPVEPDQQIRLYLLSPIMNLLLACLKTILLLLFSTFMIPHVKLPFALKQGASAGLVLLLLGAALPQQAKAADFPDQKLLHQLQERLLEADKCLPTCASIPLARLNTTANTLRLDLTINALAEVAIPLPASKVWRAQQVQLDKQPAILWRSPEGVLWLKVGKGRHQVKMAGPLPKRQAVSLSLPLRPHQLHFSSDSWQLEGLDQNGAPGPQLQLRKLKRSSSAKAELEPGTLPALLRVERSLRLGLKWEIETVVQRLSPPGTPLLLNIPLLAGESVTSGDIETKDGMVKVSMAAQQERMVWRSGFKQQPQFTLTAPKDSHCFESWRLDISPIWHVEVAGIPVVHHQGKQGQWQPQWRPWPGESVQFIVSRPAGVKGPTKTVDNSQLLFEVGKRATDATLSYTIRSNRGDQQTITLPPQAELQGVTINGQAQPIRQQGQKVTIPIAPGSKNVTLTWRDKKGIASLYHSPAVDLGLASVNSQIETKLGRDRWVLAAGGPRQGPAILVYGEILVVLLAALLLGRLSLTPLKSYHWFLLGLGISQTSLTVNLIVAGWLLALGARQRYAAAIRPAQLNLVQLALAFLTLFALATLVLAVQQGLLGHPDMAIAGNGSSSYLLKWYQDRSPATLPQTWVFSAPILVYRFIMLTWALWLAFSVLRWLKWGWACISTGELWHKDTMVWKKKKKETEAAEEEQPPTFELADQTEKESQEDNDQGERG